MAYAIWTDTGFSACKVIADRTHNPLGGTFFRTVGGAGEVTNYVRLTHAEMEAIAPIGACIGKTSQGDQIREWAGTVEQFCAAVAAKVEREEAARREALQAEIEADKRRAALIAKGGSKIFPGLRGFEEGE